MLMSVIGWIVLGSVAGLAQAKWLADVTKALRSTLCPAFSPANWRFFSAPAKGPERKGNERT